MFGQLHQIAKTGDHDFFGDGSGVSLFRFEGNLDDESGTHNGTYNSGAVGIAYSTSVKKFGTQSLTFTKIGSTTYSNNPVSFTTDAMGAVSFWGYLGGNPGDDSTIFNLNWRREANGNMFIRTSSLHATASSTFGTGAWKHIVITKSGNSAIIYVNGSQLTSFSGAGNLTNNNISIAKNSDAPDFFIDHVRLFNRGLTASEVTQLYNETE